MFIDVSNERTDSILRVEVQAVQENSKTSLYCNCSLFTAIKPELKYELHTAAIFLSHSKKNTLTKVEFFF
jgi:uncharacterized protein (AIM24 family)